LARRSVSIGLGIAAIVLPLQIFLSDHLAAHVLPAQLPKLEAIEGNWTSDNTGYVIFAIPDQQAERNITELSIPCLGSAINKDLTCTTAVPGLDLTPAQDRPLMAPVFWGFRVIIYGALPRFGTVFYATILREAVFRPVLGRPLRPVLDAAPAVSAARGQPGDLGSGPPGLPVTGRRARLRHQGHHLTGNTAVVTVTLAGAAASLASESESLTYSAGRWGFVPNDLSYYRHGSVRADIAAAKAAGYCASS
jgi:hypothetical protein